jgi:hypothetical protein
MKPTDFNAITIAQPRAPFTDIWTDDVHLGEHPEDQEAFAEQGYWRTADARLVLFEDLTDNHLSNISRMLQTRNYQTRWPVAWRKISEEMRRRIRTRLRP